MKKKGLRIYIAISLVSSILLLSTSNVSAASITTVAPASIYGISYEGHVQNKGWMAAVTTTGEKTDITLASEAGTDGLGLRVEALKLTGTNLPAGASITYQAHVQNKGWMDAVTTTGNTAIAVAKEAGTDGLGLRVEAFKITLQGLPGYAVRYQTHVQNKGWMDAVQTDNAAAIATAAEAGTDGLGLRMEALRIELVKTATEKTAEVKAIDAVILAQSTKTTIDKIAAITAVNNVKDPIEIKILNDKIVLIDVGTSSAKGYVYNTETQNDLKVRSTPNLDSPSKPTNVIGYLYNYEKVVILDTVNDTSESVVWDKITYNNSVGYAYVSNAYIQTYTTPPDSVVNIATNITKQFETQTPNQIAGNFDGQGLSLGYLQWCIGQGALQPLLNRMVREYPSDMQTIFGTQNNAAVQKMILDTTSNQLAWAKGINDANSNIVEPWNSQFINLCKNPDFIKIETDAQVYMVKQAMIICDKYNLKTVRGFALAFDIVTQNGSISSDASSIINTALVGNPNMSEKSLLTVIANAVASGNSDVLSREKAITTGQGTVHEVTINLDKAYGLSDNTWR